MSENDPILIVGLVGLAVGMIIGLLIGLWPKKLRLSDYQNSLVSSVPPLMPVHPTAKDSSYAVVHKSDEYGGAHTYLFKKCLGYNDELKDTIYLDDDLVEISFVQKTKAGEIIPGLQSEQLAIALIDRTRKLNAVFPSPYNDDAITGLQHFINASKNRVNDRQKRGVMGQLKQ